MKINSCYIENFGTLSKYSINFDAGLNTVYKENGWGKTTLAAFIKAMLFGVEYSRASENERKKYTPWNGGKFGGYMCFETGGKKYRVERSFGKTDKNDTFALYDLSTNLESSDFSEKLGEELFGVDRDSFEKSVFINVNGGNNSLLTDIMSAKMTDVPYDNNDMDRLNEVLTLLDRRAGELKAKRGNGGLIGEVNRQILEEEEQLRKCEDAITEITSENNKIREYEERLEEKKKLAESIRDDIGKYRISGKKNEYERMCKELKELNNNIEQLETFFNGNIPDEEQITENEKNISEYNAQAAILRENPVTDENKNELSALKEFFKNGIPDFAEFDRINGIIIKYLAARQKQQSSIPDTNDIVRLDQLRARFDSKILTDDEIDKIITKYEDIGGLEKKMESLKSELNMLKEKPAKEKSRARSVKTTLYAAAAIIVLSGLLCLMINPYLGIGLTGGGVIAAIFGTIVLKPAKEPDKSEDIAEIEKLISEMKSKMELNRITCEDFIKRYGRNAEDSSIIKSLGNIRSDRDAYMELDNRVSGLNTEYAAAQKEVSELKTELDKFFGEYTDLSSGVVYQEVLSDIKENADRFRELKRLVEAHNQAVRKAIGYKNSLYGFIENYYETVSKPSEQLRDISRKVYELKRLNDEYEKKTAAVDAFKNENDISLIENIVLPGQNLDELNSEQSRVSAEISDISSLIAGCRHRIDDLSIAADKKEDIEASICKSRERLDELSKKHEIYILTGELLKSAGDSLSERYMSDMTSSFKKYIDRIGDRDRKDYHIDMKLDVKLDRDGGLHEKKFFSAGKKDIIEFCVRLALLDAVYKNSDKPVIIMDDPFVNFDDEMLKNAEEVVNELAGDYQIIYFVCHGSRLENLR